MGEAKSLWTKPCEELSLLPVMSVDVFNDDDVDVDDDDDGPGAGAGCG